MLHLGVIEESSSDRSIPVVLVPMEDGLVPICVDFGEVNVVSKFDKFGVAYFDLTLSINLMHNGRFNVWKKMTFSFQLGIQQFVTESFGLTRNPGQIFITQKQNLLSMCYICLCLFASSF